MRLAVSFAILSFVLLGAVSIVRAEELNPDDKALLDELLKTTLFDPPANAERVCVNIPLRTCWASAEGMDHDAWLLPAEGEKPAQVVFAEGRTIAASICSGTPVKVDLVASARARLKPRDENQQRDEVFTNMSRTAGRGAQTDHTVAIAAWLHRRGEDSLAAELLAHAKQGKKPEEVKLKESLRDDLAWQDFAGLVHAYMVREDTEALGYGERLLSRFPEEATKAYPQSKAIMAEIERRQKKGTAGKTPAQGPPGGFEKKSKEERALWLIDALEEVDARQWGQPGGVSLASDWRVAALIDLGDAAVPALIDAVDTDERLTRSVHFWRDFARHRTVLSVKEAALTAVMSILRVAVFAPRSTGDSFTANEGKAKSTAQQLRDYWEKNRSKTIEERMRATLLSEESTQEQWREAAQNLSELNSRRTIGTTVWSGGSDEGDPAKKSPALALKDPTAAEAMLTAMDRDLAKGDPSWKNDPGMQLYSRRNAESHYVHCLVALKDDRILPAIRKRWESATEMRMRRQWALLCHVLGDPEPLEAFWKDFTAGKLELPVMGKTGNLHDEPGAVELTQCVWTVLRVPTPSATAALRATLNPAHAYHDALAYLVLHTSGFDDRTLLSHPYYLELLLPELDKTELTGSTFRIDGDSLIEERESSTSTNGVEQAGLPREALVAKATERACDRAAARLAKAFVGAPRFHALVKDRDARIQGIKATLQRFARNARPLRSFEADALGGGLDPWGQTFVPGIACPLGRAATEEDVNEGRAIFHLGADAKPVDMDLPAKAKLKLEGGARVNVIVLQAETRGSGERRYGVLGVDRVVEVGEDALEKIEPLVEPK